MRHLCLLTVIFAASTAAAQSGYSHLWWAHGYRGTSEDGRRLLYVQTSAYGAAFDVERAAITHLGWLENSETYLEAAEQPNSVVESLPAAALSLSVKVADTLYTCNAAARNVSEHANYPVRLIDGGRFLNRFDLLGLQFVNAAGDKLDADARLEVSAWPSVMKLKLQLSALTPLQNVTLRIDCPGYFSNEGTLESIATDSSGSIDALMTREPAATPCRISVGGGGADCEKTYYPDCVVVHLPSQSWDMKSNLDRVDRFGLILQNSNEDTPQTARVIFEFDKPFEGITGMCPVLCNAANRATGIPVQISKNWHRQADKPMLYEGPWFHGVTEVQLVPGESHRSELFIAYARWGGVPTASHAQLCLIGWGGNQRWDQAAIGSFGESITYDPDIGLNRSMIDDVRPLMVRSMNDGQWEWTHNVGGGDFLVYFDEHGKKRWPARMKTAYLSQGPNLTDVVYAGESDDGKIRMRIQAQTPRCDDVNRAYHRVRYDVVEEVNASRLAFYQLGADNYNDHQFTTIARGNADGLDEEWTTERGGKKYLRGATACEGNAPWLAMLGGLRSPGLKKGAWADRAIVIREWKARLGGEDVPLPHFAVYGTENGPPSANVELVPPPGVTKLLPGDFVEADIELLIMPQKAEDYYGPNEALRADLMENGGTWRSVHRLARANDLKVEMTKGKLLRRLPIEVEAEGSAAELVVRGGAGYVPITFTNIRNREDFSLTANGALVDKTASGEQHHQLVPAADESGYALTYNVPLDGAETHHLVFRASTE